MFSGFFIFLIVLMAALGFLARLGCRALKRPWLVTGIGILAAAGMWLVALAAQTRGSEGPAVLAALASFFAAGALQGEIVSLLRRLIQK